MATVCQCCVAEEDKLLAVAKHCGVDSGALLRGAQALARHTMAVDCHGWPPRYNRSARQSAINRAAAVLSAALKDHNP